MFEPFIASWAAHLSWVAKNADYIMPVIQWGLAASLIPTLLHKTHKPTFTTCVANAILLFGLAIVFLSLLLPLSMVSALLVACIWLVLAVQRYRLSKRLGEPLVRIPPWLIRILMRIPYVG